MRRNYMVPGIGEVNPESAADTISATLIGFVVVFFNSLFPSAVDAFLSLEWFWVWSLTSLFVVLAWFVVHAPLSYLGLIYRDDKPKNGISP